MKQNFLAKSAAFLGTLALAATMAAPVSAATPPRLSDQKIIDAAAEPGTDKTVSGRVGVIDYLNSRALGARTYDVPESNPITLDKPIRVYLQWNEQNSASPKARAVSPVYYIDTDLSGNFTFAPKRFTGSDGKEHKFDSRPTALPGWGEKIRMWVDPSTLPAGYEVAHSYGVSLSPKTYTTLSPGANWKLSGVERADILLRKTVNDSAFHVAPVKQYQATADDFKLIKSKGSVSGKVFWHLTDATVLDNLPSQLKGGNNPVAANMKVRASYLSDKAVAAIYEHIDPKGANFGGRDRFKTDKVDGWSAADEAALQAWIAAQVNADPSWVAETVETTTNDDGKYALRFNGTYGPDRSFSRIGDNYGKIDYKSMPAEKQGTVAGSPDEGEWAKPLIDPENTKHVNWDWMYVSLPEVQDSVGVLTGWANGWSGQIGLTGNKSNFSPALILGTHATQGTSEYWNDVNFALQPNGLKFYIADYDTTVNTAPPGVKADTVTTGVPIFNFADKTKDITYAIKWTDKDGKSVAKGAYDELNLAPNPDGTLASAPLTVPEDLLGKREFYYASLYLNKEYVTDESLPALPEQCNPNSDKYDPNDSECKEFTDKYPIQCYPKWEGYDPDFKVDGVKVCPEVENTDMLWLAQDVMAAGITPNPEYEVSTKPVSAEPTFSYPAREGVYEGKAGIARTDVHFAAEDAFVVADSNTVAGATVDATTGVVTIPQAAFDALANYNPAGMGTVAVPVNVTYQNGDTNSAPAKFQNNSDGDGDGVPDWNDACPDTPEGAEVDEDGCSVMPKSMTIAPITGVVNKVIDPVAADVDNPGKWLIDTCAATGLPDGLAVIADKDANTCVVYGTPTVTANKVPVKVTAGFKAQDTIRAEAANANIAPRVGALSADTTATITDAGGNGGNGGDGGNGGNGNGLAKTGPAIAGLLIAMGAMVTLGGGAVARRYREDQ